jgi:N-ethylmaleimide reductase
VAECFAQSHPLTEGDRDTYCAGLTEVHTVYPAFVAN